MSDEIKDAISKGAINIIVKDINITKQETSPEDKNRIEYLEKKDIVIRLVNKFVISLIQSILKIIITRKTTLNNDNLLTKLEQSKPITSDEMNIVNDKDRIIKTTLGIVNKYNDVKKIDNDFSNYEKSILYKAISITIYILCNRINTSSLFTYDYFGINETDAKQFSATFKNLDITNGTDENSSLRAYNIFKSIKSLSVMIEDIVNDANEILFSNDKDFEKYASILTEKTIDTDKSKVLSIFRAFVLHHMQ